MRRTLGRPRWTWRWPRKASPLAGARGQPGEAGQPGAGALPEFGQDGEQGAGGDGADAGSLLQAGGFGFLGGMRGAVRGDEPLDFGDALFQGGEALLQVAQGESVGGRFAVLLFPPDELNELRAPGDQRGQRLLLRGPLQGGRGLEPRADLGQGPGVERVGLGQVAQPAGELPGAGRMEHADGDARLLERGAAAAFVAAGRLTDDLHGLAGGGDPRAKRGVAGGGVGPLQTLALEMAREGGFGDVPVRGGRAVESWF